MLSWFDQHLFEFECPGPECGKVTKEVLSNLDNMRRFACSHCGLTVDLEAEPYRGALSELRRVATELDKQARQRGEVVKRIK